MNDEDKKMKFKIDKYHEALIEEREIKKQLVEKLNTIKLLVNTPLSRNKASKAGKINFLAGNGSLQLNNNLRPIDIIKEIQKLLS